MEEIGGTSVYAEDLGELFHGSNPIVQHEEQYRILFVAEEYQEPTKGTPGKDYRRDGL